MYVFHVVLLFGRPFFAGQAARNLFYIGNLTAGVVVEGMIVVLKPNQHEWKFQSETMDDHRIYKCTRCHVTASTDPEPDEHDYNSLEELNALEDCPGRKAS